MVGSFVLGLLFYFVSCSDVNFNTVALKHCDGLEGLPGTYTCVDDGDLTHVSQNLSLGLVDMLFVVDNSKSMYEDQKKMSDRFSNLLDVLEDLDFQIAITTTDVSGRDYSPGSFLKFPNGQTVLTSKTTNVLSHFQQTIKRQETLDCEEGETSKCPSSDERGIYAVNKAVESGNAQFFREEAHFAVVFLSDEDERSRGGELDGYELESLDLPATLVSNVINRLGASKLMSAYAIVVDNSSCVRKQQKQNSDHKPQIGHHYITLAEKDGLSNYNNLIEGTVGSVCANDYASQMGSIGDSVKSHTFKVQLACTPLDETLKVYFNEDIVSSSDYSIDDENHLIFDEELPSGRKIQLKYDCSRF